MGRTTNTHEGISKERAHVHFELNLLVNDRYAEWHKRALPDQRNDHGDWNGQNLAGIDPRLILLEQRRLGDKFSLLNFLRVHTCCLCYQMPGHPTGNLLRSRSQKQPEWL